MRFPLTLSGLVAFHLTATAVFAAMPYRVGEGESLWTIARKHDTTVDDLCRLNKLSPDDPIQINQRLQVPAGSGALAGSRRYVGEPFVNVRDGAGLKHDRVALARKGTPCRVVSVDDPWVKVKFRNGTTGWVRRDLLHKGGKPLTSAPSVRTSSLEKGFIAGTVVNVREGPGMEYDRVTQSRKGTTVRILGTSDGWMQVKFGNGKAGWVAQELVKLGTKTGYAYVKRDILNLRAGPGTDFDKVGQVTKGQKLTLYKRKGDWLRVQCCSGQFGWVADWLVRVRPLPAPSGGRRRSSGATRLAQFGGRLGDIIATALRYRGIRYRFGSASPRSGFDCSGFVGYVLAKHGVRLPRTARAQYGRGRSVSRSNLRKGDLVFFKNTYRRGISHVGIYMGNGNFIHASSSRGVRITSLNSAYYRAKYAGAKRVL